MELEQLEVIYTSIVVVLSCEPVRRLSIDELKGIIHPPLNIGSSPDGITVVSSPRDQLDILLGQSHVQVRDNSGQEPGKKPVSKVIYDVLVPLGVTYRAFGLNYGLVFKAKSDLSPAKLIRDKFLNVGFLEPKLDSPLEGASVRLYYPRGAKICNLLLEPYEGPKSDRFHIDLNVHEDTTSLPPPDALAESFKKEHDDLLKFLASL